VRTRPRARSLLAALFAAALGLGFVGGASGWAGGTATRRPITIRVGDFFYKPKLATVHVGQAVRFVNVGKIPTPSPTRTPAEPSVHV
jgi:plastocyanin